MHLVLLGAIVLLIYVVIRFAATAGTWLSGSRHRAYRQLASRFQGKYESRGLSEPPTVSFVHQQSNVRVGLAPQISGHPNLARTRVVARFRNGLPFRLEMVPVARAASTQAPKGTRLVHIGDQEFDRGHVIRANDAEMAIAFLSPAVRWSIGNLQRLAPPGGILISVNPERLLVQIDRNLGLHPEALILAVNESLLIHDGLQVGVASRLSQGVAILEFGSATEADSGPPLCKVCGEPIEAPSVLCVICRTPHHKDCWEYVGTCSIYGCTGKQSMPAR